MKSRIKKVKITTIIVHSLILIGAGHGIGFLGIFDIACIPNLIMDTNFTLSGSFEATIMSIGLLSFIGKIILGISFFIKTSLKKNIAELIGLLFLWSTIYFLTLGNWNYNSVYELAFWTSLPFLVSSILLSYLIIKDKMETE